MISVLKAETGMKNNNPLDNFKLNKSDFNFVGNDLQRPECILAKSNGDLWAADARGGVVCISTDGSQKTITQKKSDDFDSVGDDYNKYSNGTLPNGLCFDKEGRIVIANFGTDCVEIMDLDGTTRVLFDQIDGKPIGKANFVLRDSKGRLWITVTTRKKTWWEAMSPDVADGYIALWDGETARIVADGFRFTNEIRFDENEEYLYIVETTGGCITRMSVDEDGNLFDREIFGPEHMGIGGWPDGIAFDSYGNLWGTMVFSDRLFVITPEGEMRILLDEGDPEKVKRLDDAFHAHTLTEEIFFATGQGLAPWMASVTFGGKDLKTVYIGSLKGSNIPCFQSPIAGLPMVHWDEN
jgi:gluconolactonase